jgi:indolepyruvate ferredoxin oxidoreductase
VRSDENFLNFTRVAEAVAGDAIATNVLMLGYAWQKGLVPLQRQSIEQAISLNKVAIEANLAAFNWGRELAVDPMAVDAAIAGPARAPALEEMSLDQLIAHRAKHLAEYQNESLKSKYLALVERVRKAPASTDKLVHSVAHTYARLLAYKDEYEVARLYTRPEFLAGLRDQFDGDYRIEFNLAPPFLPGAAADGRPKKRKFGPWMIRVFRFLASLRGLRGTPLDLFGYSRDRQLERALIAEYEALAEVVLAGLTSANADAAVRLLNLHDEVRGFGPVKRDAAEKVRQRIEKLLHDYQAPSPAPASSAIAAE